MLTYEELVLGALKYLRRRKNFLMGVPNKIGHYPKVITDKNNLDQNILYSQEEYKEIEEYLLVHNYVIEPEAIPSGRYAITFKGLWFLHVYKRHIDEFDCGEYNKYMMDW